jgi:hypothetical protein
MAKNAKANMLSLRLAPKLRYLAELQAREQHRTMTNFIEWAIKEALRNGDSPHLLNEGLWDVEHADRFILLASARPDLLNEHEQKIWKFISNDSKLFDKKKQRFNRELLRLSWDDIYASEEV